MNKWIVGLIIGLVFGLLLGSLYGFNLGVNITVKKVTNLAQRFINIDSDAIRDAIFQYENHITSCYNVKDAFIHNNTWY